MGDTQVGASKAEKSEIDEVKKAEELKNSCIVNKDYSKVMKEKLDNWAAMEAERMAKLSKKKRKAFRAACIVYDVTTGEYYYGRNAGIKLNETEKNSVLFGNETESGILPDESLNKLSVGNCAEVDAVNNALNNGAKIENLYMSVIDTSIDKEGAYGQLKEGCENCTYAFRGRVIKNYAGWKGIKEHD